MYRWFGAGLTAHLGAGCHLRQSESGCVSARATDASDRARDPGCWRTYRPDDFRKIRLRHCTNQPTTRAPAALGELFLDVCVVEASRRAAAGLWRTTTSGADLAAWLKGQVVDGSNDEELTAFSRSLAQEGGDGVSFKLMGR